MRHARMLMLGVTAGAVWAGGARAQAPAAGGAAPAAAAPAAAAAKPGFFEKVCQAIDKKRRKLCAMPAGQLLNKMTTPLSTATGGVIPNFCPAMPSKEDMAKPGAEGEANTLKADAVQAAARVKAVEYMGTLDCHWHPEAEAGLVKALRTDRNECVRLAAARALCRGCCCTKAVIDALEDCVGGTEKFGPYENSPRVQGVAMVALEHCLSCYHEVSEPVEDTQKGKGEKPPGETAPPPAKTELVPGSAKPLTLPATPPPAPTATPTARYSGRPTREQIVRARQTLAVAKLRNAQAGSAQTAVFVSGQRSLMHFANYVVDGTPKGGSETDLPAVTTPPQLAAATAPAPIASSVTQPPARQPSPYSPAQASAPVATPTPPASAPAPVRVIPAAAPTPPAPIRLTPALAPPPPAPAPAKVIPAASMQMQPREARMDPTPTVVQSAYRPTPLPLAVENTRSRPVDPSILRCLETLRDATDAEVRHTAVKTLAACNWHDHPEAVLGLLHSARHDRHPGMRVACVRSLAAMKACTPEVMTGLKPMTADPDVWIRQETTQALAYLQTFMPKGEEAAGWQVSAPRK